ncbi:vWA domain-containing protein [Corynebacterium casei]|uniref:vWA domain-containing protein n=1 Tax=Corynebacterium casei TaxID=160386 RepID=UPI003F8E1B62
MGTGKVVAGILTVLGLAATSAPIAMAQESQEAGENNVPPTMLILDASGSMGETDAGGQTRMDTAKEATHTFLDGVPEDSELGFITYGTGTSNAPEEREAGCEDVTTLAPLASGQLDDIRGEVDGIEASGYTPMGPALRQAADELPEEGARNVVLVSDGIDTCAPPPVCDVAKELHDQGIDLIINTVGFLVDGEARAELECIAEAGGGQYLDANDADSLAESMRVLHTRSINAYESDLEEYEGSDSETAPTEVPADVEAFSSPLHDPGAALNEINSPAQHWRIPVEEGERLAISGLTVQPPSFGGLFDTRFGMSLDFADSACRASDWNQVDSSSAQGVQAVAAISEIAGEECGADGYVDFSISRVGNYLEGQDIPMELKITRFAGEDVSEVPDPEAESELGEVSIPENTETAAPGTWFDDAAELPDGNEQGVSADIVPGETHFYKVPVEYGQRLAAAIQNDGTDVERGSGISVDQLVVNVYNEARQPVLPSENVQLNNDDPKVFGHAAPLNYRNMEEGDSSTGRLYQDGDQYIAVNYQRMSNSGNEEVGDGEQHTAHYSLAALVDGEAQPGPTFTAASADSEAADSATSESDDVEADDAAADSLEDSEQGSSASEGIGVIAWVLLGLVMLVIAGVVFVYFSKSKKK